MSQIEKKVKRLCFIVDVFNCFMLNGFAIVNFDIDGSHCATECGVVQLFGGICN